MRKPHRNQRIRQCRIVRKRTVRKKRRLTRIRLAREDFSQAYTVHAPAVFGIEARSEREGRYRTDVLGFIGKMWQTAQRHGRVIIDFTKTSKLYPAATLLFIAELEHMLEILSPAPRVTCKRPINVKVSHVFQQLGLYATLNQKVKLTPFGADVIHWRKASGTSALGEEVVLSDGSREFYELRQAITLKNFDKSSHQVLSVDDPLPAGNCIYATRFTKHS